MAIRFCLLFEGFGGNFAKCHNYVTRIFAHTSAQSQSLLSAKREVPVSGGIEWAASVVFRAATVRKRAIIRLLTRAALNAGCLIFPRANVRNLSTKSGMHAAWGYHESLMTVLKLR